MSGVPISYILYEQSKNAVGTDCTFVFKDNSDGGSTKEIHAHRCVLTGVSPYFDTNLKSVWKGDQPIEIETIKYSVFQWILKAIYLREMDLLKNLHFGIALYEAAHFYQLDDVVDLVRSRIIHCCDQPTHTISYLLNLTLKFQDYALAEFLRVYFAKRAEILVTDEDFNNYPVEAINMLYQNESLNAKEENLFKALETFVAKNGEAYIPLLQPAVKALRFTGIPLNVIRDTVLISDKQKKIFIAKGNNDLLNPNKKARFFNSNKK